jgi:hypothetical protein
METTTIEQIFADIQAAAKAKKWVCCTYRINTDKGVFSLGVKAYGRWVQRMECCGLATTVEEKKTWRAFNTAFHDSVNGLVRSL